MADQTKRDYTPSAVVTPVPPGKESIPGQDAAAKYRDSVAAATDAAAAARAALLARTAHVRAAEDATKAHEAAALERRKTAEQQPAQHQNYQQSFAMADPFEEGFTPCRGKMMPGR